MSNLTANAVKYLIVKSSFVCGYYKTMKPPILITWPFGFAKQKWPQIELHLHNPFPFDKIK